MCGSGAIVWPSVGIVLASAVHWLLTKFGAIFAQNSIFVWPSGVNFGTVWCQHYFEVKKILKKWGLSWFARNSFLNLDTFKSSDLIGCKDSYWELLKCFKMITWLQWFLCQLSHWWWVESNWSVISCGFPMMSVIMSIILSARHMCRVKYIRNFIITLFV